MPKQLLELEGRLLLQHVIDATCASNLSEVVVVLGYKAEQISQAIDLRDKARIVINNDYLSGQASSLRVGLAAVNPTSKAAAIIMGDQPKIDVNLINLVLKRYEDVPERVLRPLFHGSPGHPVVVPRLLWGQVTEVRSDVGLREEMQVLPVRTLELDMPPVCDVDTLEDYARLSNRSSDEPTNLGGRSS
jgi:molybdenum cofactor cytidylyltransferase